MRRTVPLFLLAITAGGLTKVSRAAYPARTEVIMRGGESIRAQTDSIFYFGDYYEVDFPLDGALRSQIFGSQGLWHIDFAPNPNSLCVNSAETVRYKLMRDGNFMIKCGSQVDYISHSHQDEIIDTFMAIDDGCKLHIFEGSLDCNTINIDRELWSSDIYEPLGPGDRFYKGQVFHGIPNFYMMLKPSDGDLEVRNEMSHGTYDVVWKASDEWNAPPSADMHDYYVKITNDGHLLLVGIDYSGLALTESIYFDKDLGSNGASCFTLGWEYREPPTGLSDDQIDLIAVPVTMRTTAELRVFGGVMCRHLASRELRTGDQ